ncbi:MAG: phosphoribosylglycinamide formyltransferase [Micrococcales bacterium 73-13]|nr:MAG: phosphoribosylglycinamide formyltransferase [Micrococcales bacterium 73-13]
MLRVVVLISGGGTNLRALLEAADSPDFPARVVAVGSDVEADGLAFAEERGIPTFVVPLSGHPDRDAWGEALLEQIAVWEPGLTVLSGFMRLLPQPVVDALAPALVNTHPAYLPEFPGAHGVRDALEAGVHETGASVIVVDDGVDTGPVIVRERVPVLPGDTEASLHERIKPVERRLLIRVVREVADGRLDLKELSR